MSITLERPHPDDVRDVMAARRPFLLGAIKAVQIIEAARVAPVNQPRKALEE